MPHLDTSQTWPQSPCQRNNNFVTSTTCNFEEKFYSRLSSVTVLVVIVFRDFCFVDRSIYANMLVHGKSTVNDFVSARVNSNETYELISPPNVYPRRYASYKCLVFRELNSLALSDASV